MQNQEKENQMVNSRVIKFRAWDKEKNKMAKEVPFMMLTFFGTDELFSIEDDNRLIWMQYTGLKDKNGKEIYEGDILHFRTRGGNDMTYTVRWSGKGFGPARMSEHNKQEMEIIGNIYENPKLIK